MVRHSRPAFRWPRCAVAVAAAGLCCAAQALTFAEAYDAARRFDGPFRSAAYEVEGARMAAPQARSLLLPNLALSASGSTVTGTREFPNALNQEVRTPLDYSAPQYTLQLRQPIFNYEALSRYRQTLAQIEGAEWTYTARGLEMLERLGTAYLQALLSNDNLALSEAELKAYQGQAQRAEQRLLRGEGTRTEVAQTETQVNVARVRLLEAQDQIETARRALRKVTGVDSVDLRTIPPDYVPEAIQPARLEDWVEMGEAQNPTLAARRKSVEGSRYAIERAKAGHLPRLDLVASVGRSRNESISSLNQTTTSRSLAVQLSVPIFSGGAIEASIQQSVADSNRAQEDLRTDRESMQVEIEKQYYVVVNGAEKVAAYRRVVTSAQTVVEGATRSLEVGLGTTFEVLDAQARLFSSLRDLAQSRYEYLAARMRLMMQSGQPAADVVADLDRSLTLNAWLKTRKAP